MSKAGERLLRGAEQALAYAEGRAVAHMYRVHSPEVKKITSTTEPRTSETQTKTEQNGNITNRFSSD